MNQSVAVQPTRLLRGSDDLLYTRLRELLVDYGVDPKVSVLADLFPDDGHMEQGYILTPDRRVFAFELHNGKGDLDHRDTGPDNRTRPTRRPPRRRQYPTTH